MLKVLHGPVNIGNQPWVLSRYERQLGVDSQLVVNYNTWLGYSADRILSPLSRGSILDKAKRLAYGLSAPFQNDVLHYYFGLSFLSWNDYGLRSALWFRDLSLARQLGRKVFMTLQGCDVRISTESARRNRFTPCMNGACAARATCESILDKERRRLVEKILPLCDRVFVLNPELVYDAPGSVFLPYASVDIDAIQVSLPTCGTKLKIVHAPSDPAIKGSQYIVAAIERLKAKYPIEFIQVSGIPHNEALKIYQQADLIIDQVLAGWYGGFAVEAMAMGKPVACYIREQDLRFVPEKMAADLPLIRVSPDTVEQDLENAILRRESWRSIGIRSREYVVRWHHPLRIAEAMVAAYRDPLSRFQLAD